MASAAEYFDRVLILFQTVCASVNLVIRDERPERALLKLTARYREYELCVSEIVFPNRSRKYAYYILQQQKIIAGFDNAPDPEVLKLKYGTEYVQHRLELTPHMHGVGKMTATLTDNMDIEQFLAWVQTNLSIRVDS